MDTKKISHNIVKIVNLETNDYDAIEKVKEYIDIEYGHELDKMDINKGTFKPKKGMVERYGSGMSTDDWRTYGEIQYIRGRLDELFKIDELIHVDLTSGRIIDARISKYMIKLQKIDPMAYELYRIERENIKYSLKRASNDG